MTKKLCFILLFVVTSCALYQTRGDKLKEAVFYFNEGVRWGRLDDVLGRLDPKFEEHFLEMHKDFGTLIKVENCEVVNSKYDKEKGEAEVGIKITWYRIDEMVLRQTVILQKWEDKSVHWTLVSEEYKSGTPF
jgi:hypothetical protein